MKAKDLLNQTGGSRSRKDEEQDQVAAAYESISKKLESLRSSSNSDESDADEGDKLVTDLPKSHEDEDEKDIEPKDDDKELDPLDQEDDTDDGDEDEPKSPKRDKEEEEEEDPLDQEDDDLDSEPKSSKDSDDDEDESIFEKKDLVSETDETEEDDVLDKDEEDDEPEEDDSHPRPTFKPEVEENEPDSLDDLASEKPGFQDSDQANLSSPRPTFTTHNVDVDENRPADRPGLGRSLSDLPDDESDMHIPNLRSSVHPDPFTATTQRDDFNASYGSDQRPQPQQYPAMRSGEADVGERTPSNFFSPPGSNRQAKRGSKWHVLVLLLIGLAVIGGTVYVLKYQFADAPVPSPTPAPVVATPEPTATPAPELDRSQFKIRVLNGTTTAGLAKTVSETLKTKGYQIERAGNAPKQDFAQTEIKVKSSATGLFEQLKKDLAGSYDAGASASAELKDTDAAEAEIIIGEK